MDRNYILGKEEAFTVAGGAKHDKEALSLVSKTKLYVINPDISLGEGSDGIDLLHNKDLVAWSLHTGA